jgi:hypothetical protein
MADETPPRYRLGPRSTRGLIAGWRSGQIASVAVGALLGLGFLRSVGGVFGAGLAFLTAGAGVAVATWPVGGRPIESWVPVVARYARVSVADGRGMPWLSGRHGTAARSRRSPLRLLDLRTVESTHGSLAVVEDRELSTWSAVIPVGGNGFALVDDDFKAEAIAGWSSVLAAMAAEARSLRRLQWIASTRASPPLIDGQAAGPYERIVEDLQPWMWNRDTHLVVTTDSAGAKSVWRLPARVAERDDADTAAADRLVALVSSLRDRLAGIGLSVGQPLDAAALASLIRASYQLEPDSSLAGGWPWPVGVEGRWSALRTDATWQATYWVSEWPRGDVGPGVLVPLLVGGLQWRTVALVMAPLPAINAVRRAERERTAGAADAELRHRHGFSLTARARVEQELRLQREAELAAGHAAYLFSGYVSVTAGDELELEAACHEMEQAAAQAQLEVRRLYGAQEEAWCCTLPSGRGCG